MSGRISNNVVTDGLILYVDPKNPQSVVTTDTRAALFDKGQSLAASTSDLSTGPFSIVFWYYVNPIGHSTSEIPISVGVDPFYNVSTAGIIIRPNNIRIMQANDIYLSAGFLSNSTGMDSVGNWNHIVFTYDDSNTANGIKMYLNGIEESPISQLTPELYTGMRSTDTVLFGNQLTTGTNEFEGRFDNPSIYTKELTPQEVYALYNEGSGLSYGSIEGRTIPKFAAKFTKANNESLSSPSTDFDVSTSFSVSGWFKITDSSSWGLMNKDANSPNKGWVIDKTSGFTPRVLFSSNGTGWDTILASTQAGSSNWFHMAMVHEDGVEIRIYVNNVKTTAVHVEGAFISTADLTIGKGVSPYLGGEANNVNYYTKPLTDEEVSALYNGGEGQEYADLSTGQTVNLTSWWSMSEASGVRFDSHASNDLTDNNTVGYSVSNVGTEVITTLPTDLVSWYSMNETQGSRYDQFGGNHLTDNGGVGFVVGKVQEEETFLSTYNIVDSDFKAPDGIPINGVTLVDGAWEFDGINDYMNFGQSEFSEFQYDDTFTLESWVKFDVISSNCVMSRQRIPGPTNGWMIFTSATKLRFLFVRDSATARLDISTVETPVTDKWYNIMVTHDGTGKALGTKIYLNGQLVNVTVTTDTLDTGAISYGSSDLAIGGRRYLSQTDTFLNGSISNSKIYNRALSATEVLNNYNTLKGRFT